MEELNSRTLTQCFIDTLSPEPEPRRRAEQKLSDAACNPNYGLTVLHLIADPSVEQQIRHSAAVNLKNHLKTQRITDSENQEIKQAIIPLMLSSSSSANPKIHAQLSETLAVIANRDFPNLWLDLLPELKSSLEKAFNDCDYASVRSILAIANTLFKKFRYQVRNDVLLIYLNYCLDNFAAPLLSTVERLQLVKINEAAAAAAAADVIEAQTLCCRIFYSLHSYDLPEFFEYNVDKWMKVFKNGLELSYPAVAVELVDELRVAVCDNISLYMEQEEELFDKYVAAFVDAVLRLVVVTSASSTRERVTVKAIKFLTIVNTSGPHHALFSGDDRLQQITESIVIPNVMLRDEDEELFKMNFVEFIRRDSEGRNLETRRRIACDLVKGIGRNYKEKIAERVSMQISSCLALFAKSPAANWKYKDCAIYLVVALATKGAGGGASSTDLVDVESFFRSVVEPELRCQDVNAFPMLKACALKYFSVFRILIPGPVAMPLLGDVVRFLTSDVNVVHSYAASCIENLLLVKDDRVHARYTSLDIDLVLAALLTNLFVALTKAESEENPYIMRCIMRVLQIADITPELALRCIAVLTTILKRVYENPKNPVFNHYLFEAVATIVGRTLEKNTLLVPAFEARILPSLRIILLEEKVTEFFPYAFQLLAQLVDMNRTPLPIDYMYVCDQTLLAPDMWKTSANVPALVRLLQSFLQQAPDELNGKERLRHFIGISCKLVFSPITDEQGFHILNPVIENLGYDVMAEHMNDIWATLFTRLQQSKTPRLVRCLIIFMSRFLVKYGIQTLVDSINSVQANLFHLVLDKFWTPNLKTITGHTEFKLSAVASTKLLCESPSLLDPAAAELWGKFLDGIVTLLTQPEEARLEDEQKLPGHGAATRLRNVGKAEEDPLVTLLTQPEEARLEDEPKLPDYGAATRLRNVGKAEEDPLKEIVDPKHFSVSLLARLSSQFPGRFPPIIARSLSPANQTALVQLCNSYNLTVV